MEGLTNQQIAILSREYAPFKGKKITAARARQLMNILDRFKDDDLKKLSKANIPFVSSGSASKLAVRNMGVKITNFNPMGSFKEEITQEDFDLEEGKMKTIATMFSQGKSAEEIAKKMKLPVDTVKSILGEVNEGVNEQLSMKATFKNGDDKTFKGKTASDINKQVKEYEKKHNTGLQHDGPMVKEDLEEKIQPFMISYSKYGKHAGFEDAKSLQDLQTKAQKLRAKGFTIDKMGRYNPPVNMKDAFDPLTEACWTGYKQVGMKKKGGKMVPNCVPEDFKVEEYITEEDDSQKLKNQLDQKDNEIAQLKQKAETDKAKNVQKSTDKMVNPETGEPLLQVGIAYKHLKDKMAKEKAAEADRKEKKAADMKNTISKLKDKIKESALNESAASDKAKAMGLDYMKFGRYGKDGKVLPQEKDWATSEKAKAATRFKQFRDLVTQDEFYITMRKKWRASESI